MNDLVQIFDQLKSTNSRLGKEEILRKNETNQDFLEVLRFAYDPLIVTGLAKRKITKEVSNFVKTTRELDNLSEAMNYVRDNNTGDDTVIKTIQSFLNKLTEAEKELATYILIKNMPYGISRTTINKTYGENFINKYGVQLAGKFDENQKQFEGDFAVTLKLDGNRITFFNYESGVKAYSRSGKEVEDINELSSEISKLPKNMVYDGEILADLDDIDSSDLFRATQTIVRSKGEKKGVNFVMFDTLPISEFNNGISKKIYKDRIEDLKEIFNSYVTEDMHIKLVPMYYTGNDKSVVKDLLRDVISQGFEGLIVNPLNGYYETKRTKSLLKVKEFYTIDLRVVDVTPHSRNTEMAGSIIVDYKGYRVGVGSGLNDNLRREFWKNKDSIVGKIVEIRYFEESSNAGEGLSLRFPTFLKVRTDKMEASYN